MSTRVDERTDGQDLANRLMEPAYADPETSDWIRQQHEWTLEHPGERDSIEDIEREIAATSD